jgi:hypothetical protein
MKCAKCGFISFDYLAACKKCGTNLNQARTGLGFSDVKPEPPPFLKALVEEGGSAGSEITARESETMGDAALKIEQAVAEGPALARATPFALAQAAAPVVATPEEQPDEWAMDSKWLEEFDKKSMADMPEVDDLILELVDDDIPARAGAASLEAPMDLTREFSSLEFHADDSLDDLVFEDVAPAGEPEFSLTGATDDLDLFAQPAAKPVDSSKSLAADLDDLVLELGDDTLDLAELELEESSL